jgi:hypothetical protein
MKQTSLRNHRRGAEDAEIVGLGFRVSSLGFELETRDSGLETIRPRGFCRFAMLR